MLLDLSDNVRIVFSLLRKQDGLGLGRKFRNDVHGNPDHPQVARQKILARRMKRLIGLHANRFAKLPQKSIDLRKYLSRDMRRLRLRWGRGLVERPYIEERDFRRLGEEREPELFRISAWYLRAALIDPSARVAARLAVLKVAEDGISISLLQGVGTHRGSGSRAALIDPSARVAARLDVLKVAEDGISVVLLQVLIPGRVSGFRARVDLIEVLRLRL